MIQLILLAIVGFFQNAIFTLVSRSRNSGDPQRHFFAAICSNGIWFITTFVLIIPQILDEVASGEWSQVALVGGVYAVATAAGSWAMMKVNLGHWYIPFLTEKDKARVGQR